MWSNVDFMRSILHFLDTQSWQMQEPEEHSENDEHIGKVKAAMLRIIDMFQDPLKANGVKITSCLDEIENIVEYIILC